MTNAALAYGRTARTGLTGRAMEAALLNQCARDFQRAMGDGTPDFDALERAIVQNRRVWSFIVADATEPDAGIPPELRDNLVSIGSFMLLESLKARVDPSMKRVEPLIRFNRIIAEGLATPVPSAAAPPAARDAPAPPAPAPAVAPLQSLATAGGATGYAVVAARAAALRAGAGS